MRADVFRSTADSILKRRILSDRDYQGYVLDLPGDSYGGPLRRIYTFSDLLGFTGIYIGVENNFCVIKRQHEQKNAYYNSVNGNSDEVDLANKLKLFQMDWFLAAGRKFSSGAK